MRHNTASEEMKSTRADSEIFRRGGANKW